MPITRAYNKAASLFPPISNLVINGGFDIWQRGTSFTALGKTFTADRWWKFRGGDTTGGTWSRQNSATSAPGTQYCMRIQRDSGNTSTATMQLYSDFETSNSIIYAGQQITVSFYARKGANYSGGDFNVTLQTGTGTDQSQFAGFTSETTVLTVTATAASMNTSTFVRYSGTVTLATTVTQLGLKAIWTPTGTAGAADFVEITGIQLELGPVATQFTRAGGTLAGELAAAQRYYEKSYPQASAPAAVTGEGIVSSTILSAANGAYWGYVPFKVTKRGTPTITIYGYSGGSGKVSTDSTGADQAASSGAAKLIGQSGFSAYNNSGGTVTTSGATVFHWVAESEL